MAGTGLVSFFRNSMRRRSARRDVNRDAPRDESKSESARRPGERSPFCYSPGQFFFEYLVVVSLKKKSGSDYEPKIIYQFPKRENLLRGQKEEEERLLQAIPLFCFPDGNHWAPLTEYTSETFSFVLTNVDGSRKIGYCRRLLPVGRGPRFPEVFCIISCLGCFGLFSKILDEVEKRRQISMAVIYPFMQGLRESPFPAPGKTVTIKSFIPDSGTELHRYAAPFQALPLDQTVHPFRIGDQVLLKKWKRDPLTPRWDGPHTVSLISQAAVKILGSDKWTHHTRVKRFLSPDLETDSTDEDTSPLSAPALEARGGTGEDTVWEYQGFDGLKGLFKRKR